jgi:SAM-dependent methyltransferase
MGYHQYVFDEDTRAFLGRFEDMYRAERVEGFDSWHQDNLQNLTRQLVLSILNQYTFDRILDLGCGKGAFTHCLKKLDNKVVAVDVSPTALATARARYSGIDFLQADIGAPGFDARELGEGFDLAVCLEVLSYLQRWPEVLAQMSRVSRRALVLLYLPEHPIGFVKTFDDLAGAFAKHFEILEDIRLLTRRQIVLFGETLAERESAGQKALA